MKGSTLVPRRARERVELAFGTPADSNVLSPAERLDDLIQFAEKA
jgi:hypothetical protein